MGIQKIKNFIAVASGKGGVGKTTVSINLALALQQQGFKVGLLDADIYGPSVPTMLALHQEVEVEQGMIKPLDKFGLKIMSIGFMIDEDQPVIWRGPMVSKTIKEFLNNVLWKELDYLVVDLPPGTGDPSINMFQRMGKGIEGIVENMSYFSCEHSEDRIEIFGKGGGEELSRETGLELLGELPIDIELRQGGDVGKPLMVDRAESETGKIFQAIAEKVIARIIERGK